MKVRAKARHIHMSPRKVRLVVDAVRGLDVAVAQAQLKFMNKAAARPVLKLLNSAVANAEHNFKLKSETLKIGTIQVDGGPTIYRFKPRAFGRSAPIRKRTSHITIVLDDDKTEKQKGKEAEKPTKKASTSAKASADKTADKPVKKSAASVSAKATTDKKKPAAKKTIK